MPSNEDNESGKHFSPKSFDTISSSVKPLAVLISRWGTVIAVEASNTATDFQMKTNWVKKSDPQASSVFLLDTTNSQYYYPLSSSLKGDVVPGHPKIGLIAFEPFIRPIQSFQVHFSNVAMQKGRDGKQTFHFVYKSDGLEDSIANSINKPSLYDEVSEIMSQRVDELHNSVRKTQSGCLIALSTGLAGIAIGIAKIVT